MIKKLISKKWYRFLAFLGIVGVIVLFAALFTGIATYPNYAILRDPMYYFTATNSQSILLVRVLIYISHGMLILFAITGGLFFYRKINRIFDLSMVLIFLSSIFYLFENVFFPDTIGANASIYHIVFEYLTLILFYAGMLFVMFAILKKNQERYTWVLLVAFFMFIISIIGFILSYTTFDLLGLATRMMTWPLLVFVLCLAFEMLFYRRKIKEKTNIKDVKAVENESFKELFALKGFRSLNLRKKFRLLCTVLLISAPLIAYLIAFGSIFQSDKEECVNKYENYVPSEIKQKDLYNEMNSAYGNTYYEVHAEIMVKSITDVNQAESSFSTEFFVFTSFSENDLKEMVNTKFTTEGRGTPTEEDYKNYYPDRKIIVGNGTIENTDQDPILQDEDYTINGSDRIIRQKLHYVASIGKTFDSVRYPLESLQFHIYLQPTQEMTAQYMRFVRTKVFNEDGSPKLDEKGYQVYDDNSGWEENHHLGGGYKTMDKNGVQSDLYLLQQNSTHGDPGMGYEKPIYTEYMLVIRANRSSLSLFVKVFLNMFAVVIWLFFNLFNTVINKEDAIGPVGVALFGAISSVLIGVNMLGAGVVLSLANAINFYSLGIILVTAIICISANKSRKIMADKKADSSINVDKVVYHDSMMKILFVVLAAITICVFVALPCISFIW